MSRYSPAMPRRQSVLSAIAIVLLAASVQAAGPGEISQETLRSVSRVGGVLQAWWLPPEYWLAAAEKQGWPEEKLAELRDRVRHYFVLGVIDAKIDGTQLGFAEHTEIAERISVERNGTAVAPLRVFDPSLARVIPELSYFLRISLGPLQEGLRLLFFPNLSDGGEAILVGSGEGELLVRYRPSGDAESTEFIWRSPLTSVAGTRSCPEGREPLEASWRFCPWHGVEVKPGRAE
jgi:hypothetical protein